MNAEQSSADSFYKVGSTYEFNHQRKGKFTARVLEQDDEWLNVVIVKGAAHHMSIPDAEKDDVINLRKSFCTAVECSGHSEQKR